MRRKDIEEQPPTAMARLSGGNVPCFTRSHQFPSRIPMAMAKVIHWPTRQRVSSLLLSGRRGERRDEGIGVRVLHPERNLRRETIISRFPCLTMFDSIEPLPLFVQA